MTRAEFDKGWDTLKGAGLRGTKDANPDVYFSGLWDLEPELWAATVGRLVRGLQNGYLPSVPEMYKHVADAATAAKKAETNAKLESVNRLGRDPKTGEPFVFEHPRLKRKPTETVLAYAARLAVQLGHAVTVDEPRSMPKVRKTEEREIRLPYKEADDEAWEAAS